MVRKILTESNVMNIVIANAVGINSMGKRISHFPTRWTGLDYAQHLGGQTFYPFMLGYTSSLLKRETDYNITFVDGVLESLDIDQYVKRVSVLKPDLLVVESASVTYKDDLEFALGVKKNCGTTIVSVGAHSSVFPEVVLSNGFDFAAIGEFEYTILDLARKGLKGKVPGLYGNPSRGLTDIDLLPFPEDEDVRRIDYREPFHSEYREIEFFTSRGCPMACSFCVAVHVYYQGICKWRHRTISSIIAEINCLQKKYPEMKGLFIDDEAHNSSPRFVMDLCRAICENGLSYLKFNAMCGAWSITPEMAKAMAAAGYYKLRLGIETASEKTAEMMGSKIDLQRTIRALELLGDVGIKVQGTFTIGAMGSTEEEDRKTIEFGCELAKRGLIQEYQVSLSTPMPGTPYFSWAEEKGYLLTKDWNTYDGSVASVVSYPNYSAEDIKRVWLEAREAIGEACTNSLRKALVQEKPNTPSSGASRVINLAKQGIKKAVDKLMR
jgi:radical SAM superfamily enzyme YgiQ (UPF0313 family)